MDKDEMNTLADLIVEKLLKKQDELDREAESHEHMIAEYTRLETLIQLYSDQEKYEKAAIINNKLMKLREKLKKLGIYRE